jgi:Putative peptidoglycan binding domain
MRIFVVLICGLWLVSGAYGAQQEENKQKKKQPPTVHHAPPPAGHATGAGAGPKKTSMGAYQGKKGQGSMGTYQGQKGKHGQPSAEAYQGHKGNKGQTSVEGYHGEKGKKGQNNPNNNVGYSNKANEGNKAKNWSNTNKTNKWSSGQGYAKVKTKHYNLSYKPNPKIQNVKFDKSYYIQGSQNWKGERYAAFRSYHPEWHDQWWWRNHYNRVVFISGGWYAWNGGWWYPAWGYAPNAYYAYNGPIYGYNGLPPDQVIANVQAALQQQSYYRGEVDGLLGPLTRAAIADYQRDHGLYLTSAIDRPTLESLGIA